jgi:hypothetical protein
MNKEFKTLFAVLFAVIISVVFTSCYGPLSGEDAEEPESATRGEVIIRHQAFNFSQTDYDTRAALSDESNAKLNAITISIYDASEKNVLTETQFRKDFTSNPEDFGVFKVKLSAGTYSLLSVGYDSESSAATFNNSEKVTLPAPFIDTWSVAVPSFEVKSAGSIKLVDADLKLAVTHVEFTSTDLPTEDAAFVRLNFSAGNGQIFDPNTQNAIAITSDKLQVACTIANFVTAEGKFHFDKSFFIPASPTNVTLSFDILNASQKILRSYEIGTFEFKRGYINHFTGPVFTAAGDFAFTATTNWEDNENVEF